MKTQIKKIGILTSGGDAPGMNPAIRAIVKCALNNNIKPYFIYNGYFGLVNNQIKEAEKIDLLNLLNQGGTKIFSSRLPEFKEENVRKKAVENLKNLGIQALVTIGGDGTYMGALRLTEMGINCVGLPGTIDNNIVSSQFTIGFDTALNTIVNAIDNIRDTSSSHHRCSIIEVMGQSCGDLALYAGLATGAELISTYENKKTEDEILEALKIAHEENKRHCIIVVSEHLYDVKKLEKLVKEKTTWDCRATVLGHIQRGGKPSARDRIISTMMGCEAVNLLIKGVGGVCIGIENEKIINTPIIKALSLPKNFHEEVYEFWKKTI